MRRRLGRGVVSRMSVTDSLTSYGASLFECPSLFAFAFQSGPTEWTAHVNDVLLPSKAGGKITVLKETCEMVFGTVGGAIEFACSCSMWRACEDEDMVEEAGDVQDPDEMVIEGEAATGEEEGKDQEEEGQDEEDEEGEMQEGDMEEGEEGDMDGDKPKGRTPVRRRNCVHYAFVKQLIDGNASERVEKLWRDKMIVLQQDKHDLDPVHGVQGGVQRVDNDTSHPCGVQCERAHNECAHCVRLHCVQQEPVQEHVQESVQEQQALDVLEELFCSCSRKNIVIAPPRFQHQAHRLAFAASNMMLAPLKVTFQVLQDAMSVGDTKNKYECLLGHEDLEQLSSDVLRQYFWSCTCSHSACAAAGRVRDFSSLGAPCTHARVGALDLCRELERSVQDLTSSGLAVFDKASDETDELLISFQVGSQAFYLTKTGHFTLFSYRRSFWYEYSQRIPLAAAVEASDLDMQEDPLEKEGSIVHHSVVSVRTEDTIREQMFCAQHPVAARSQRAEPKPNDLFGVVGTMMGSRDVSVLERLCGRFLIMSESLVAIYEHLNASMAAIDNADDVDAFQRELGVVRQGMSGTDKFKVECPGCKKDVEPVATLGITPTIYFSQLAVKGTCLDAACPDCKTTIEHANGFTDGIVIATAQTAVGWELIFPFIQSMYPTVAAQPIYSVWTQARTRYAVHRQVDALLEHQALRDHIVWGPRLRRR